MILIKNITRKFGDIVSVNDVSLEIAAGEVFALLGPNGAGKTTIIKMLTTLLAPTSGTLTVDGIDPAQEPGEVRKRFGIVFQDASLDHNLTAQENLEQQGVFYRVPRQIRRERIHTLLRRAELWDRRNELVKRYSGGMMRRLEIARALIHTPRILYLDEPTLGLDPQSRNQLWAHVQYLNRAENVTVLLTTHYMEEAERMASRIAVIDHGQIVALGSPAELKKQTNSSSLEEAFLALTGNAIRDGSADALDHMRRNTALWRAT